MTTPPGDDPSAGPSSPPLESTVPRQSHWSEFPGAHPVCPSDPPEDSPVRGTLVEDRARPGTAERRETGISLSPKGCDTASHSEGPGRLVAVPAGERPSSQEEPAGLARPPSLQAKRLASLARVDEKIRRRATSIVDSALRAPELADLPEGAITAPEAPKGWTKKALRIAADATNSMKSAPAYLAMAQRVVESYKKAEADRPTTPQLNAEIVQITVNNQYNYPTRVLDED